MQLSSGPIKAAIPSSRISVMALDGKDGKDGIDLLRVVRSQDAKTHSRQTELVGNGRMMLMAFLCPLA